MTVMTLPISSLQLKKLSFILSHKKGKPLHSRHVLSVLEIMLVGQFHYMVVKVAS